MSLADRLPTIELRTSGCRTCCWYDRQPDRDKKAYDKLEQAVKDKHLPIAELRRILADEGLVAVESSLRRHIRRECTRVSS